MLKAHEVITKTKNTPRMLLNKLPKVVTPSSHLQFTFLSLVRVLVETVTTGRGFPVTPISSI